MISGGYIIQPRIIQQSDTAHKSPCFRETWAYLLRNASHRDNGKLKRGQLFTTLKKIQDDLFWFVGYRKITYSRRAIEGAIEGMREGGLLVTTKVTHGMIITICKYDYYQDPKNYEGNNEGAYEGNNEGAAKVVNINKNDKNDKKINIAYPFSSEIFLKNWELWKKYKKEQFKFTYKPIGEQSALDDLREISNNSEEKAIEIINNSISKGWRGLFEINGTQNKVAETTKIKGVNDLWKRPEPSSPAKE